LQQSTVIKTLMKNLNSCFLLLSCSQETISKLVGEVVLCLKDSNAKTREAAFQLLLSMANTHKDDMPQFVQLVAGALGAETTHMRSAAAMALSRLVFEYSRDDPAMQVILPSLLQTVLVLFEDTSREVIKSVVGFVRVSVAAMSPEQLQPLLPEIVHGLLKYHKGKDRFRAKIKIILKKLVKMFGFHALEPLVPRSDTRLLTHMRKLAERDIRRKSRIHDQRQNQERTTDFDGMVGSDEEDSDDGRTLMTGATGLTRMTTGRSVKSMAASKTAASQANRTMASSAAMSRKSKIDRTVRLRNDATGDVFDVSDLAAKSVRFAGDGSDDDDSVGGEPMEFDGAGKLIVRGDFDDNAVDPFVNGNEGEADKIEGASGRKRRLNKFETAKVEKEEQRKNQSKKHGGMGLGAAFKAKRAGGDSKRKGQKFEPYAFVPLDGRNYTKKNRRGAVEQMETVVRKGAKRQRR
jgi:ribosomal RNA-processing protein 12